MAYRKVGLLDQSQEEIEIAKQLALKKQANQR
jgi:hypothetical protein